MGFTITCKSALAVAAFALIGCGEARLGGHEGTKRPDQQLTVEKLFAGSFPIRVACTTGMVADLVRNVGGDHVAISQIMGEGVDPHLYKASPGDVKLLSDADLIFYSGLHLEGKMA